MSFALKFREHPQFHRSVLKVVLAGTISGLLYWMSTNIGLTHWPATVLSSLLLAISVGGANSEADPSRKHWHIGFRALLIFVGLASVATQPWSTARLGFALAFAAAFAIDRRGWRSALAAFGGGLGGLVALEVAARLVFSNQLSAAPAAVTWAVVGGGFGLAMAVPMALRHLEVVGDFVASRFHTVSAASNGEVHDLVSRGYLVWNHARELPEGDENRALLKEAVLRLFDTAEHWSTTSGSAVGASESGLRDRMLSLHERIESTTDTQVRSEYEQAHQALSEQLKYLDGIKTNRERVVARLHNYLAAMERLRLALLTAQSSREAAEIAPMASTLEELGRDIESEYRA